MFDHQAWRCCLRRTSPPSGSLRQFPTVGSSTTRCIWRPTWGSILDCPCPPWSVTCRRGPTTVSGCRSVLKAAVPSALRLKWPPGKRRRPGLVNRASVLLSLDRYSLSGRLRGRRTASLPATNCTGVLLTTPPRKVRFHFAFGCYTQDDAYPAVPRSTQPSTLRGMVNEYQLSS